MHHHDIGHAEDACDRCYIAEKIVIELIFVERRIDRGPRGGHEQRIAVRRRAHDCLGPDHCGRARPVLDYELLAESLRQPLTDQARDDVGRAGGWKANDDAHRPRRISRVSTPCALQPEAQQRPLPDARIYDGEVSRVMLHELEHPCPPTIISKSSLNVCFWHKADITAYRPS